MAILSLSHSRSVRARRSWSSVSTSSESESDSESDLVRIGLVEEPGVLRVPIVDNGALPDDANAVGEGDDVARRIGIG